MRKTRHRYAQVMNLLRKFDTSVTCVRVLSCAFVLIAALPSVAQAQGDRPLAASAVAAASAVPQAAPAKEPSVYDRVWTDFTQWYKNDDNPAVQQVLFTGR